MLITLGEALLGFYSIFESVHKLRCSIFILPYRCLLSLCGYGLRVSRWYFFELKCTSEGGGIHSKWPFLSVRSAGEWKQTEDGKSYCEEVEGGTKYAPGIQCRKQEATQTVQTSIIFHCITHTFCTLWMNSQTTNGMGEEWKMHLGNGKGRAKEGAAKSGQFPEGGRQANLLAEAEWKDEANTRTSTERQGRHWQGTRQRTTAH